MTTKRVHYCPDTRDHVCYCGFIGRCDNCDRDWKDHDRETQKCLYGSSRLQRRWPLYITLDEDYKDLPRP